MEFDSLTAQRISQCFEVEYFAIEAENRGSVATNHGNVKIGIDVDDCQARIAQRNAFVTADEHALTVRPTMVKQAHHSPQTRLEIANWTAINSINAGDTAHTLGLVLKFHFEVCLATKHPASSLEEIQQMNHFEVRLIHIPIKRHMLRVDVRIDVMTC